MKTVGRLRAVRTAPSPRTARGHAGLPAGIVLALILAILCSPAAWASPATPGAQTSPETPRVPLHPPRAPETLDVPQATAPAGAQESLQLPPLKAVLLVGPIDGDDGAWTTSEKQNMDLAANELAAHGVTVYKFYTPNNDWTQIKAAADGANFLFYRGHGIYWSPMPNPVVGGFALKDKFVSSDDIRNDLHLAPNAIVMLYACFSAGTAGNDTTSITSQEAQRRVAMYSDPFLDIGVAGYYANWFGEAFPSFVRSLFEGKTLGQAYESFWDFNSSTVERYVHPEHPSMVMWLDKDFWDNMTQYNNAFAGSPDLTLAALVQQAQMQVSPTSVTYVATPSQPPRSFPVAITNATGELLSWTASLQPASQGWLSLQSATGNSEAPAVVTLQPAGLAPGVYTAVLHVISATPGVADGDQSVGITLRVVPVVHKRYLPGIRR